MESVYLETSFISYLVSKPSRDLFTAAAQQLSGIWWSERRTYYDRFISEIVINEISLGDTIEAGKRMEITENITVLKINNTVRVLTKLFLQTRILPNKAIQDAIHISIATAYNLDYILTWNFKHMANVHTIKSLNKACSDNGYKLPLICTPAELMEIKL